MRGLWVEPPSEQGARAGVSSPCFWQMRGAVAHHGWPVHPTPSTGSSLLGVTGQPFQTHLGEFLIFILYNF